MKLDILAFGAHPDDVELGACGTLLIEKSKGKKIGIIDLTQGELGTRGTPETRKMEAEAASKILGLDARENLGMADGFFGYTEENIKLIVSSLRAYQPEIVLCNAPRDRHPDHGKGSTIVVDACFLSGLRKIETFKNGAIQSKWRPKQVFQYMQDQYINYDILVDISPVMHKKLEAIKAFTTQFSNADSSEPVTYISKPNFLDGIVHRHAQLGKNIGVDYAEAFASPKKIGVSSLFNLVLTET
jgi:N-acetylglucosamine malate deacetylase 1